MLKASKRSNGELDYDSTRAKKSKWSRSNRQLSQIEDVPDSEKDLVSMSIQASSDAVLNKSSQIQARKSVAATKEAVKRTRAVMSNLANTVKEGKQKLANSLEGNMLRVINREHELRNAFIKVIIYAQQDQTDMDETKFKQPSISKTTAPAISRKAKISLGSSRELLGHYEKASRDIALSKRVPMMEPGLDKEKQALQRIFHNREEKAKLDVHQILNNDLNASKGQVEDDVSKLDINLWDHYAVGEAREVHVEDLDRRAGETWAVVAKNAQRGVQLAVQDLPGDDE